MRTIKISCELHSESNYLLSTGQMARPPPCKSPNGAGELSRRSGMIVPGEHRRASSHAVDMHLSAIISAYAPIWLPPSLWHLRAEMLLRSPSYAAAGHHVSAGKSQHCVRNSHIWSSCGTVWLDMACHTFAAWEQYDCAWTPRTEASQRQECRTQQQPMHLANSGMFVGFC